LLLRALQLRFEKHHGGSAVCPVVRHNFSRGSKRGGSGGVGVNTIIDSVQQEDPKRASPVRVERAYIRAYIRIYKGPAESRYELCRSITMVQPSEATIASRWFRRKASQRLAWAKTSRRSLHPTGDGSLGKIKTEHGEFPMDPRCSPGWVLGNHLENQFSNLLRRLFPSNLPPDSGN